MTPKDISEEKKLEILKEEYFKLLDIVFHYDKLVFQIKGALFFAITTLIGVIVKFNYYEGVWVILILTFIFWFLESVLKTFQYFNYARLDEIGRYLRGEKENIYLLQATLIWYQEFKKNFLKVLFRSLLRIYVCVPYMIIIIGALYLSCHYSLTTISFLLLVSCIIYNIYKYYKNTLGEKLKESKGYNPQSC